MCWSTTSTGCGNNQCSCSCKNNRRNLYVRPRYAGLVYSSGWILFCLFYGMRLRKPTFIPSCLQKLWFQNNTSSPFWNSHYLCNCRLNVRGIAASRLAQNAPLEHFAGLQPSLHRFLRWVWLRPSFTILTTMVFGFMSLLFSGCASCALIFLLHSLPSCFLFSPLCELSSSWFLREILRNRFRNSRGISPSLSTKISFRFYKLRSSQPRLRFCRSGWWERPRNMSRKSDSELR